MLAFLLAPLFKSFSLFLGIVSNLLRDALVVFTSGIHHFFDLRYPLLYGVNWLARL